MVNHIKVLFLLVVSCLDCEDGEERISQEDVQIAGDGIWALVVPCRVVSKSLPHFIR